MLAIAFSLTSLLVFSMRTLLALFSLTGVASLAVFELVFFDTLCTSFSVTGVLDFTSVSLSLTVVLIRVAVFTFSYEYLKQEKFYKSFHITLALFVASIIVLVTRPNFLTLLVGWDGLGLRSFLLVMFYANPKSLNARLITFFSNRVGDRIILVLIFLLLGKISLFVELWAYP